MSNLPQNIKLTIHGEEIEFSLTGKREIKYYGKTVTSNESLWRTDKLEDNEVFYQSEWGWGVFVKIEERIVLEQVDQTNPTLKGSTALYSRKLITLTYKNGSAFGELDHPSSDVVSLTKASHIVIDTYVKFPKVPRKKKKKMKKQGTYNYDIVFVKYKLLTTEEGKLAKQFIDNLVPSPRGIGSVDANGVVNDDYQLISIDLIRKETKS